jgi:hypothetical protein
MWLIVGTKTRSSARPLSTDTRCPRCQVRAFFLFNVERRWLTLFFIPLFCYYIVEYLACPVCGYLLNLSDEEARAAREDALRLDDGEGESQQLPASAHVAS